MKPLLFTIGLLCLSQSIVASTRLAHCDLIYDEFDHLMHKDFLLNPSQYVTTKAQRLSRQEYNAQQKGKFLLSPKHKGLGIAIVQTNYNTWGKLLFTWGRPIQQGNPSLVIKKLVLYGRVKDGYRPRIKRNLNLASSYTLDLDTGQQGGQEADIWFHNIDGKTMYIEAVNGAKLQFPMQSLCHTKNKPQRVATTQTPKTVQLLEIKPNTPPKNDSNPFGNPDKHAVKKELLPNGHILITYSDGSKEERYNGGVTITAADGTQTTMLFSTAAPVAIPPELPDTDEQAWLGTHNQRLLNIIRGMVSDPTLVDSFLNTVDTSNNVYESIQIRSQVIEKLTTP